METTTMGRVTAEATIENLKDLWLAQSNRLPPDQVRRIVVADGLVDTGATQLSLPSRLVHELGLQRVATKRVASTSGIREAGLYEPVRLTIQGRFCTVDVVEVPDTVPVLIGQLPLEGLDLVVDPIARRLIGNPAHGGEEMYELY